MEVWQMFVCLPLWIRMIYSNGFLYSNNWPPPLLWHPNSQHQDPPNKTPTQFGSNTFTIFCQIIIKDLSLWDDWSYKEPKEILCFWSRSISLFEKKYTIKKTGWRLSWVIVWLKYFHCLKVKTLLGFYWNGKYNLVLIIR